MQHPHNTLRIYRRSHVTTPATQQIPLIVADIHPGLGASSHIIRHFQKFYLVQAGPCFVQRNRAGLFHKNFPTLSNQVRVNEFTSAPAFAALSCAHALIFSNEYSSNGTQFSTYVLEALLIIRMITPYFAIIFGPMNTSISSTENATIKLHAARAGYNVSCAHHHTHRIMPPPKLSMLLDTHTS